MGAKLFFYYSAMNAGKSASLLQASFNYKERGMQTKLFVPKLIGNDFIFSRVGLREAATPFGPEFDFLEHVAELRSELACVMIDEAQFLTRDQVVQLGKVADRLGVPVLCYGLRTDFMGNPFEGSQYLLGQADVLQEIKTICWCGRKATMNNRVGPDGKVLAEGEQAEVGGNERYVSKCRRHFYEALEEAAARTGGSTTGSMPTRASTEVSGSEEEDLSETQEKEARFLAAADLQPSVEGQLLAEAR